MPVISNDRLGRRQVLRAGFSASLMMLLASAAGCIGGSSQLMRGERVNTGKRNYDNYFEEVADISERVDALDSDLFPLRQPLTTILDVDVDVSLPDLLYATRKRAAKLKDYGVIANLQLTSSPTVILSRGEMREDEKDEALFKAVQESAVVAMKTYKQYSAMLDEIVELDQKRGPLAERIDQLGPNHPQRSRIETELVGAGKVLAKAEGKLLRDTRTVAHFLVGLAEAVDTGALAQRDAKCEAAIANEGKKPRWRKNGGGKKPRPRPAGRPRPRPRPRPAPKPAPAGGGGDFDM